MRRAIFAVTNDLNFDQRMHKICGSLQNHGYDVLLVGRKTKRSEPLVPKSFRQKRMRLWFENGKLFYLEYNWRLFWFLLSHKADIICAIDLDTIAACTLAGKLKGSKLVYDAHEYFTEVPEVMHRPLVQKLWQWVEKTFIPRMNACYTVSGSLAKLYQEKYGKKFELIRNVPVLKDEPKARLETEGENRDKKFILYQGALNKGRGLETLIECMHKLPLELYLVGEGDLSSDLRKLVHDSGLQEKVKFLGWVLPEELEKLTPRAFVGYNLLENLGRSYYFSLSNKFFDYIHACLPGLSNHFPEYESIIGEYNAGILTNLFPSEIVLKVLQLLENENYYESLRENCRKARLVFNWQEEEKKLTGIYDALL